jgi:hypothetical protein
MAGSQSQKFGFPGRLDGAVTIVYYTCHATRKAFGNKVVNQFRPMGYQAFEPFLRQLC